MWILLWIFFGGLIGWAASLITDTDADQGVEMNIITGALGAVIGGWLMSFFGESGVSGFNLYSFVVALIGATFLLTIAKVLRIA